MARRHHSRSQNRFPTFFLIFILTVLIVGGSAAGWMMYEENQYKTLLEQTSGTSGVNTPQSVVIEKGSSINSIANLLVEKKLIVSKDAFVRYAKETDNDTKLNAGTFSVTLGLTIPEVTDILTGKVKPTRARITIPEGLTIREIAALLVKQGYLENEEEMYECITTTCDFSDISFLPPKANAQYAFPYSYMEGYLFPDTYFVETDTFSVEKLLREMLRAFDNKVLKGLSDEIAASDRDFADIMIMASIIEKESRPRDDQSVVAGILWKRFDNGVQLAADATNRYIKENPLEPIYQRELVSNDPYNGRRIKGLPPSAISNPGVLSIKATLEPTTSEWWYYLHDNNGIIRFGRTENEHNRNKSLYLQ